MNIYDRVLDRLKTAGWQQDGFGGCNTPNCIAGAFIVCKMQEENITWEAARRGWVSSEFTQTMNHIVKEQYDAEFLISFNDSPSTNFEDVVVVLEKASANFQE